MSDKYVEHTTKVLRSSLIRISASSLLPSDKRTSAFQSKPEVKIRKARKSGKPTKRHLSLRRFQKSREGLHRHCQRPVIKVKSRIVGSSDLCRIARGKWVFTRILC
ncbi:MAG: hypothetical protein KME31_35975 [Tolypothrix carrinoi HA7290-LM1]|jgi:hypothetical protein|nr:hypothetical protein [Tolypothrix carrinoi HA7290-LM1]